MKRWKSLRWRIFFLMAAIAIVECVVLGMTVIFSGVFTELDAEAFRFFQNDAAERAVSLDDRTGQLIANLVNEADSFNASAQQLAADAGIPLNQAYRYDRLFNSVTDAGTEHLLQFLGSNPVSSAFFILNGSNTNKDDADAHSAIYIRDSAPGVVTEGNNANYQLVVGPISIASEYNISTSNRWELDMRLEPDSLFYENPIAASQEYPRSELVRYGYWAPPGFVLQDDQQCIAYTLPILDASGDACGVIGFDISLAYFTQRFFSNTNLPYQNSFFAITSGDEQELDARWVIPGNLLAQEHLHPGQAIHLQSVKGTESYSTDLPELGPMYCTVNELTMYSKNSPFADQSWIMTGMVEQSVLNETSHQIGSMLVTNMLITLGVSFIAIFLLTYVSTRRISGLSESINDMNPGSDIKFRKTELLEIDELTSALERINRRINDSLKVTSKIMELTQLPLGGFEVSKELDTVMLTEYVYSLLHLKQGEPVSKEMWDGIYQEMTARPADGYADVYRYDLSNIKKFHYGDILPGAERYLLRDVQGNSEDMYHSEVPDDRQKWLRIIEAKTDTGTVGMVQDVTADIEEFMRLTHELDYDALTHLYNRTAFKREAFKKIMDDPDKIGAMIFSDLDNLKYTNDTYGHEAGDRLITTAADMFREFIDYGGIVARISGDEFAIFLYGFDSKEDIMAIVQRLYSGFATRVLITADNVAHRISQSSGIAWYPDDSKDITDLLKLSDYAMYEAKHSMKGTLFEFNEESYKKNAHVQETRKEFARLINNGLFNFLFQPIVNLHTGEIYGYEALMHSLLKFFRTPKEILAAARLQSKLGQLERDIFSKAFTVIQKNREVIGDRKVFINSVAGQSLSGLEFEKIKRTYRDILDRIVIEVTEDENNDVQKMAEKFKHIRDLGALLAIDDFGAGYSNEVRIIAMQPDIVKIDLSLVVNLSGDKEKQKMVGNLVTFCHARGIRVAAECVENENDLEILERLELDYAQGFFLGKPSATFDELSPEVRERLRKGRER